jgi:hypothetical protein
MAVKNYVIVFDRHAKARVHLVLALMAALRAQALSVARAVIAQHDADTIAEMLHGSNFFPNAIQ